MQNESRYVPRKKIQYLPDSVWRQWPVVMSQTLTVESAFPDTRMLECNSIPEVRD